MPVANSLLDKPTDDANASIEAKDGAGGIESGCAFGRRLDPIVDSSRPPSEAGRASMAACGLPIWRTTIPR